MWSSTAPEQLRKQIERTGFKLQYQCAALMEEHEKAPDVTQHLSVTSDK